MRCDVEGKLRFQLRFVDFMPETATNKEGAMATTDDVGDVGEKRLRYNI